MKDNSHHPADETELPADPASEAEASSAVSSAGASGAVEESEEITAEAEIEIVRDLEKQLLEKESELARLREDVLRARADVENVRRRLTKEKNDFAQFANEKLIRELLPVHGNMERALNAENATVENLKTGVDMIFKQFTGFLEKENVKPIPSVGEKFNPARHEVVSQIESDQHEEGTVIQECSKGYFLNDRVLIPAKVVISKKPASS